MKLTPPQKLPLSLRMKPLSAWLNDVVLQKTLREFCVS